MPDPTQGQGYELPEWLLEKAARAVASEVEYLPTKELILSDFARVEAAIRGALSECPVLGLTAEEIDATVRFLDTDLITGADAIAYRSFRSKLLATRKALEGGGRG